MLAALMINKAAIEQRHHRLAQRKVAGGAQAEHPLAGLLPEMHLAESGNAVDAGIGAAIGQHDQPVLKVEANAIGHETAIPAGDMPAV